MVFGCSTTKRQYKAISLYQLNSQYKSIQRSVVKTREAVRSVTYWLKKQWQTYKGGDPA